MPSLLSSMTTTMEESLLSPTVNGRRPLSALQANTLPRSAPVTTAFSATKQQSPSPSPSPAATSPILLSWSPVPLTHTISPSPKRPYQCDDVPPQPAFADDSVNLTTVKEESDDDVDARDTHRDDDEYAALTLRVSQLVEMNEFAAFERGIADGERRALSDENARLRAEIADAKAENEKNRRFASLFALAAGTAEAMWSERITAVTAVVEDSQQQMYTLTTRNALTIRERDEQIESLTTALASADARASALAAECAHHSSSYQRTVDALTVKFHASESHISELMSVLSQLAQDRRNDSSRDAQRIQEMSRGEADRAELRSRVDSLKKRIADMENDIRIRNRTDTERTIELEEMTALAASKDAQLVQLEDALTEASERHEAELTQANMAVARYKVRVAHLETEVAALNTERMTREEEYTAACERASKYEHDSQELASLNDVLPKLIDKCETKSAQCAELERIIADMKRHIDTYVSKGNARLANSYTTLVQYRSALEQVKTALAAYADIADINLIRRQLESMLNAHTSPSRTSNTTL